MSKDQWLADLERASEDFAASGDEEDFRSVCRSLGMRDTEIEADLKRLREERGDV